MLQVLVDTLWALSYISDGGDDRIRAVIEGTKIPDKSPHAGDLALTSTPPLRG